MFSSTFGKDKIDFKDVKLILICLDFSNRTDYLKLWYSFVPVAFSHWLCEET